MNSDELESIVNKIKGNNSGFECVTCLFLLKLFDKVFLEKSFQKYIDLDLRDKDVDFFGFLKEKEIKEYLLEKYKENVVTILDKYFPSFFINSQLLKLLLDIVIIKTLPSVYDSFSPFIKDKFFNISNQIIELSVRLSNEKSESIYVPFKNGVEVSKFSSKKVYCEYLDKNIKIVELFMKIYDGKKINVNITDSLKKPSFHINNELELFDSVIAFPPFSLMGELNIIDIYDRFKIHSGRRLDVACFEHILSQTKKEAIVLMPVGFSFRSGAEERFRKFLIENNYLKASIQLPSSIHTGTSLESTIYIIDKTKKEKNVLFFDLRDKKFISKNRRQTILKDIDKIVEFYNDGLNTENISIISNDEIRENSYNLSIDRYVLSEEAKEIKNKIYSYNLVKIEDIAEVKKCQTVKENENFEAIYEISPSDFSLSGYTFKAQKEKRVDTSSNPFKSYKLEPFDILLSAKGVLGKVAIVGKNIDNILASQAIQRIRLKKRENIKKDAIVLYMYLKSSDGQQLLHKLLKQGTAMPQISTTDLKEFFVPVLNSNQKDRVVDNFNLEIKKYKEIKKIENEIQAINHNFLEGDSHANK